MATQNMKRIMRARCAGPDGDTVVDLTCGHVTTAMHYDATIEQWLTCMECDARIQEARFGVWVAKGQAYVGGQYELSPR